VETATLVCKWGHLLTTENSYVYREGKKPGCRRCRAESARRGYQKKLKNPLKPCTRCRTNLRQQKGSYCRPCENEYQREWWAQGGRESGKAKRAAQRRKELGQRATALKFKYNLSLAEYAEMLDQQQGLCLICRRPSERTLVVDHDHGTGLVRGLLCVKCNTGIGMLREDPRIAFRAMVYLKSAERAA
jgi:hypothetical protein